jgi:hypothetical protein
MNQSIFDNQIKIKQIKIKNIHSKDELLPQSMLTHLFSLPLLSRRPSTPAAAAGIPSIGMPSSSGALLPLALPDLTIFSL